MAEPSLGELASAGQSQEAIPTIAVNNQQEMVRTLNQQAQFKAENDWRKYQSFLKERSETLSNLAEIQKMDVMNEDRPELQKDAAKMYQEILENPGAFIGKNPAKFDEIQGMYGGLLAKATQSKQFNSFDLANRKYLAENPELNTEDNKQKIDQERKKPLDVRTPYTLNLPTVMDVDAYTTGIMNSPSVKTDYATSEVTPDNQFIVEQSGQKYSRENFLDKWMGGLDVKSDKYGHSISNYVQQQYKKLPDDVKERIPGKTDDEKARNFWKAQGEAAFGSKTDIISDKKEHRTGNPGYLDKEKLAEEKVKNANTASHQKAMEAIGWARIKSGNAEDDDEAVGVVNELTDIINFADTPENTHTHVDENGKSHEVIELADPDLLKKFSTIQKDGKLTKTPDMVRMDKETGQLNLVYLQKNKKTGIPVTNKTGGYQILESKPINARTWAATVVGRNESAKNKGKVNNMVQDVITKNGGLYNLAKKMKGDAKDKGAPKTYKVNGKDWSEEQLKKGADHYKISLEEYKQQLGITE